MVFDRLKDAAQQAKTAATDLGNAALERITQSQKELNEAIPIFRATGAGGAADGRGS